MGPDMTTPSYSNPWIPARGLDILSRHEGTLLDVGGGAAPYVGATHVLDVLRFDAGRLKRNAWGTSAGDSRKEAQKAQEQKWSENCYTQLDLCDTPRWPFDDNAFDLGLCSHTLEDLRDPFPAVRELSRVCRQVLIVVPSRLLEQTRGIDHPRYCGFPHHPWIVTPKGSQLVFRRKTLNIMLPSCHIVCPMGKTLRTEDGAAFAHGLQFDPVEDPVVWTRDVEDYSDFVAEYRKRGDLFVHDGCRHTLRYWIWKVRQSCFGAV